MIERRLKIDPSLLVSMFQGSGLFKASRNRLPEDARLTRWEMEEQRAGVDGHMRRTLVLWISSCVFHADDPIDLPAVEMNYIS